MVQLLADDMLSPEPTKLPVSATFVAICGPTVFLAVNIQLNSSFSMAGSGVTLISSDTLARSSAEIFNSNSVCAGIVPGADQPMAGKHQFSQALAGHGQGQHYTQDIPIDHGISGKEVEKNRKGEGAL